ncbi:hypothetical protein M5689_025020 [Euphorbia peplus]|nr:hypothetical protein M5689_025020 [Euphorbia peplus]
MAENLWTSNKDGDFVIDIPESLEVRLRYEACISRVPAILRRVNEAAYNPQLISIGPIHHGKHELRNMETQKLRYLKLFCQRIQGKTQKQAVNHLFHIIKLSEEQILHCYDDPFDELSSSQFVKMILLDSVFVVEYLLRDKEASKHEDDFVIGQPSIRMAISLDLRLYENQLPYFVIEKLYYKVLIPTPYDFGVLTVSWLYQKEHVTNPTRLRETKHFIDMVRHSIFEESNITSDHIPLGYLKYSVIKLKYNASKLHRAGVTFEAVYHRCGANHNFINLDVKFVNGVLKIPFFGVPDVFEHFAQNMMAYEQRHYPYQAYIRSFFFLMNNLIHSGEDVELLVDAGIIVQWLGSSQMFADFISKLCKGMNDHVSCYDDLYEQLNEHYENKWNHRKATLRLVYFSNIWRGTGTIAATLLLFMTLIQAIASIKSLLYN